MSRLTVVKPSAPAARSRKIAARRFDPSASTEFSARLRASLRAGDDTTRAIADAKAALDSELLALENELRLRKAECMRAFADFVRDATTVVE